MELEELVQRCGFLLLRDARPVEGVLDVWTAAADYETVVDQLRGRLELCATQGCWPDQVWWTARMSDTGTAVAALFEGSGWRLFRYRPDVLCGPLSPSW